MWLLCAVTIGGQFWVEFVDSSDSAIEGNVRCFFLVVCWFVLVVVCFLFGLCGCCVITGSATIELFCWSWLCGVVAHNFFGITGIRAGSARETFEWTEESQLESSVIRRCFFSCLPLSFFLAALASFSIRFSVAFPVGFLSLRSACSLRLFCRLSFVSNLAKSELLIVTSCFPRSSMIKVWLSVLITDEPGVNTFYKPCRFYFDLLFFGIFFESLRDWDATVRGTGSPISGCCKTRDCCAGSWFLFRFFLQQLEWGCGVCARNQYRFGIPPPSGPRKWVRHTELLLDLNFYLVLVHVSKFLGLVVQLFLLKGVFALRPK